MTTPQSQQQGPTDRTQKARRPSPPTVAQVLSESHEQRIRRMYDMTPEEAADIIRESGILTASGRLKRGYR